MAAEKIIVGSKLPNGLILKHPTSPDKTVTIRGLNSSAIRDAAGNLVRSSQLYVTTEVDAEFWQMWKIAHSKPGSEFAPLKSGAIFEAKTEAALAAIAKERQKQKTGLEPIAKDAGGVKEASKE